MSPLSPPLSIPLASCQSSVADDFKVLIDIGGTFKRPMAPVLEIRHTDACGFSQSP